MSRELHWSPEGGRALVGSLRVGLLRKPVLPFAFEGLLYAPGVAFVKDAAGAGRDMTAEEVAAVEALLDEYASLNSEEHVFGVDADGMPLGLVPRVQAHAVVGMPPAGDGWRWHFDLQQWERQIPLAEQKVRALEQIDSAAGAARMRHITEVPGQQGVYLRKREQALAYLADGGEVPPYIQAEAEATGLTPAEAAQRIATIADAWDNVLSPAIERERIRGKTAVEAAESAAAVQAELQTTLTQLSGI